MHSSLPTVASVLEVTILTLRTKSALRRLVANGAWPDDLSSSTRAWKWIAKQHISTPHRLDDDFNWVQQAVASQVCVLWAKNRSRVPAAVKHLANLFLNGRISASSYYWVRVFFSLTAWNDFLDRPKHLEVVHTQKFDKFSQFNFPNECTSSDSPSFKWKSKGRKVLTTLFNYTRVFLLI